MHDVIIIGAGPSGLNTARRLARGSLDVVVLEKETEIGKHVICTGIISKEAYDEYDLSCDSVLRGIKKIKLISPSGNSFHYEHPSPFASIVDRKKFDKYLGDDARNKGVEIRLRSEVSKISVNKNCVDVFTEIEGKKHKKYSGQIALITTGINYNLNKMVGLDYPREFLRGVQAELHIDNIECPYVFFGRGIAPGAFAWVVPADGKKVRIGLMTEKNPNGYFEHFIKSCFPEKAISLKQSKIQFKSIAQGLLSKTFGDRILAIGEAAGQIKTTTGGGIYFGLLCSEIASQVVIKRFKEGCFSARELAEYEKLWKKAIQREILIGYYARKIYSNLSDIQIEKMIQIAKNNGIIPLIREKGKFDWHHELILHLIKQMPFKRIFRHNLKA